MMTRKFTSLLAALLCLGLFACTAQADEWEEYTPYYEDDAWYDISEWFDGNDYNPTDEQVGRIDDETYDYSQDNLSDQDNDSWYGYDSTQTNRNDDWFYDYYDYWPSYSSLGNSNWYESYSGYYDFDGDGYYDGYTISLDKDQDGIYESVNYYSFNNQNSEQQKTRSSARASSSKQQKVTGTVSKLKRVNVGNREHLVASLKQQTGPEILVDIGRASQIEGEDFQNRRITAWGLMHKIGNKSILLATSFNDGNETVKIDRESRKLKGRITDTRREKVQGVQHQFVILRGEGDSTDSKRLVDLGPASQLKATLRQGDRVTVQGIPVKVGDRHLIVARQLTRDGQQFQIDQTSMTER